MVADINNISTHIVFIFVPNILLRIKNSRENSEVFSAIDQPSDWNATGYDLPLSLFVRNRDHC